MREMSVQVNQVSQSVHQPREPPRASDFAFSRWGSPRESDAGVSPRLAAPQKEGIPHSGPLHLFARSSGFQTLPARTQTVFPRPEAVCFSLRLPFSPQILPRSRFVFLCPGFRRPEAKPRSLISDSRRHCSLSAFRGRGRDNPKLFPMGKKD